MFGFLGGIGSALSSAGGAVLGAAVPALGAIGNFVTGSRMADAQTEQTEYMKWAQANQFQREDNATVRRAEDLRRAGLSPVLAAGSAAQATPPVQIGAKGVSPSGLEMGINAITSGLGVASQMAAIGQTRAATEATDAQAQLTRTENAIKIGNNPQLLAAMRAGELAHRAGARSSNASAQEQEWMNRFMKETGLNLRFSGNPLNLANMSTHKYSNDYEAWVASERAKKSYGRETMNKFSDAMGYLVPKARR